MFENELELHWSRVSPPITEFAFATVLEADGASISRENLYFLPSISPKNQRGDGYRESPTLTGSALAIHISYHDRITELTLTNRNTTMKSNAYLLSTLVLAITAFGLGINQDSEKAESEFSKPTIDLGCVVSDIDASVKFYTEAIGFEETGGFKVDADYATDVGLTNGKPVDVKVLTLGKGAGATQLKLMQVEGESAKSANDHIETTLGFSYITVFVKSTDGAIERLKKANVKPVANGPLPLPANEAIALTVVRDPDGNFVELVGPTPTK